MMKKSCVRFAGAILGAFLCIFLSGCYPVLDLEPRETSDLSVIQLINKQNKAADPNRVWRRADSYYMRLKVTLTGKELLGIYAELKGNGDAGAILDRIEAHSKEKKIGF